MSVQEVLQGCGPFRFDWSRPLPASVRRSVPDGATLCVFDSIVNESEADRAQAVYEGIVTIMGTSYVSGWEPAWLLQKPSGAGPPHTIDTGSVYLDERVDGTFPMNGISFGTAPHINVTIGGIYGPANGPGHVAPPTREIRTYMDLLVQFLTKYAGEQYSWKIGNGLEFSIAPIDELFTQLEVVISDAQTRDFGGQFRNIPASFEVSRSIEAVVTDVIAYGNRNDTTGVTPTETVTTAAPFTAPDGSALVMRRLVDAGGNQGQIETIVDTAAASGSVRTNYTATLNGDPWETKLRPGDRVYVHSMSEDITDNSNTIDHFGVIHPQTAYVRSVTRNRRENQSVMFRKQDGSFIDVTDFVPASTAPATVELSSDWSVPYTDQSVNPERLGTAGLAIAQRLARSQN